MFYVLIPNEKVPVPLVNAVAQKRQAAKDADEQPAFTEQQVSARAAKRAEYETARADVLAHVGAVGLAKVPVPIAEENKGPAALETWFAAQATAIDTATKARKAAPAEEE